MRYAACNLSMLSMPSEPRLKHLRVLVVDPDRRVRQSLCGLIGCLGEQVEVVGTAADTTAALQLAEAHLPQIVIVDPRLPDIDAGLALISELRRRWPQLRIMVMGWADSLEYPAVARGADAFIRKEAGPNELLDAVRRAWALAA